MKVSAFAIIKNGTDSVLLCHRRDIDLWNLPGGGVEPGEAPWQAVIREVKEEVCLDVEIFALAGIYWKKSNNEISLLFECNIVGGQPSLTAEADQIEFFNINEIPVNTSVRQRERIHDAFGNKSKITLRDHEIAFDPNLNLSETAFVSLYTSA